ncbi:MAG: hypothetical protein HZC12_04220 [Nitrospirae bacterium]|nr:hypothetical protein [Nitrospirota bacterium]
MRTKLIAAAIAKKTAARITTCFIRYSSCCICTALIPRIGTKLFKE